MNGSGGGCAPSPGSNGSTDGLALPSCDAAASAGTWRHKLPAARMAPGGSRTALRLTLLYPLAPCGPLAWLPSRCRGLLNPPNRRIRTRTPGGVGGEESRDFPLSRSICAYRPSRSQDDIRRERDQLRSVSAKAIEIAGAPAVFDPHVAADGPAESRPAPA